MSTIEDDIRRIQIEQATKAVNECFDALVGKQPRRNIPEALFVNEFLPYFSGQKPITEDSDIIANWTTIAGTAFAEVEVMDNAKNVVVVVPGLMQTLQNNLQTSNTESFKEILAQTEVVGSQVKVLGTRYLNNKLDEKQKELVEAVIPEAIQPIQEQWRNIFDHYKVTSKVQTAEQKLIEQKQLDDDVEYV